MGKAKDNYDFKCKNINETDKITLEKRIQNLLNEYSRENKSNTPDFVLAEYLMMCLKTYERTVNWRDKLKHG